jgi:hypothetical protein
MSYVFKTIEKSHITITPFYANKLWVVENVSVPNLLDPTNTVIDADVSMSIYYGCYLTGSFISSSEYQTSNGEYIRSVWHSANHLYYRNFQNDPWTYKQGDITNETRNIGSSVYVLSIPSTRTGTGIKRGTFQLKSGSLFLFDDSQGNIIGGNINTLNSSSYNETLKNFYHCSYYYHEGYKYASDIFGSNRQSFSIYNHGNLGKTSNYNLYSSSGIPAPIHLPNELTATANNVIVNRYGPDSPFYFDMNPSNGTGSAYLRISHNDELNFGTNDDFSVAMWIYYSGSISSGASTPVLGSPLGSNLLLSKNGRSITTVRKGTGPIAIGLNNTITEDRVKVVGYPYQVELIEPRHGYVGAGKIRFSRSDGAIYTSVTSSAAITANAWNLITCRKSGSLLDIWVNGSQAGTGTDTCLATTKNDCDVFVGCRGDLITTGPISLTSNVPADGTSQYYGRIGSVHIFDSYITDSDITGLYGTWVSGSIVNKWGNYNNIYGNILYNQGIVILSNGRGSGSTADSFANPSPYVYGTPSIAFDYMKYRSTKPITSTEVICVSGQSEHNMSTNPSILVNKAGTCNPGIGSNELGHYNNDGECYSFVTGSDFSPYITTVGLYNDEGDLLVVGKLASPIKKAINCDTIFIVRYDQ